MPPKVGALEPQAPTPNQGALEVATAGCNDYLTFHVVLQKTPGSLLGVDVTYSSAASWTRHGVFIARLFDDGLIPEWNKTEAPDDERKVRKDDLIFQVNGMHSDPVSMIQELKLKQSLALHVLRRSMNSLVSEPKAASPAEKETSVYNRLLDQLLDMDCEELAGVITVMLERYPSISAEILKNEIAAISPKENVLEPIEEHSKMQLQ